MAYYKLYFKADNDGRMFTEEIQVSGNLVRLCNEEGRVLYHYLSPLTVNIETSGEEAHLIWSKSG